MAKRRRYTDEERANIVLMLEAAGYPDKPGALTAVANRTGLHARTISRWFNAEQNQPPDELVNEKRFDLLGELTDLLGLSVVAAKREVNDADFRELATAIGILVDKIQLLSGKPTNIDESRVTLTEQEKRERVRSVFAEYADRPPSRFSA